MEVATIIIADNQVVTSEGIRVFAQRVLQGPRFEKAHNKKELISKLELYSDAIVVLDYTMFDFKGIEDFLIILNRFSNIHWILFSSVLSEQFIRRAAAEEKVSIIFKDCSEEEIESALKAAVRNSRYLCIQVETLLKTVQEKNEMADILTPTETEILKLIAQGNSVKEIAAKRFSSTHTIVTHKKNIFMKLGVNNVYEATKYALRAGLIELMEYYI